MAHIAETKNTHLALLHRIGSLAGSDRDTESILGEMVGLAVNVTRSDATHVYLIEQATNEIVLRASHLSHDAETGRARMKIGEGAAQWAAARRSVIAVPQNAGGDSRFRSFGTPRESRCQAFLSVPVVDRGEVLGAIQVQHKEPHRHTSEELALVAFVGEQMGGVIARDRLAERSVSALHHMQTLAAVAQTVGTRNRLDGILEAISKMLAQALDCAICSVLLADHEKKELIVGAARCSAPDYMHSARMRLEGSLAECVMDQVQPVIIPDIHTESRYRYPELARKSGLTTLLAAPLTSHGKTIGCLNIYTREGRQFSGYEIGFVKVVAGQVAVAIQNARLMTEALHLKRKLEGRKVIERAKGILQHKHNLTEEEAYLRLRDESSRLQRSMRVLAEAVVLAEDLGCS